MAQRIPVVQVGRKSRGWNQSRGGKNCTIQEKSERERPAVLHQCDLLTDDSVYELDKLRGQLFFIDKH